MTRSEIIKNILTPNISIGDLVRLNEDFSYKIGIGIIEDIKLNYSDIYDINYLLDKIDEYRTGMISSCDVDGFFPTKPQALVMWSSKRLSKANSMWVYISEITVVHKVLSPGENK